MKSIGKVIKEARTKKRFSLGLMENKTKIKKEFIKNIQQKDVFLKYNR